jgi:hypothetical protein
MGIKGGKRPGAGRKKGVPNKTTQKHKEIVEAALDKGLTPLEYMLSRLRDNKEDAKVRREMAVAAAPYVHPKLAAIEHSGKDGKDLFSSITVKVVGVRPGA